MEASSRAEIVLIAPKAPPYGGMALQAARLYDYMRSDSMPVVMQPSNPDFPPALGFLERARGLRPFLRLAVFCRQLWAKLPQAGVVHLFACSWEYFFFVVWPAAVLCRLRGTPLMVNYRGGDAPRFFGRFGWLAAPVFRAASEVTAPSAFLAELIAERFGVQTRIVPNILDTSLFPFRQRTRFAPRLIVTRHLEKIYDIESVLKAFRAVQQRHGDASLEVVGSGSEERRLRELTAAWELRNVRFRGHVPHRELAAVYSTCDILINASVIDNFPGALLEASAAGLAIVSTDAGGIPFIYQNGKNAILVRIGDWQGLADGIEKVINDTELAATITRNGALVVKSCEWNHVRKILYRSYGLCDGGVEEFGPAELRG